MTEKVAKLKLTIFSGGSTDRTECRVLQTDADLIRDQVLAASERLREANYRDAHANDKDGEGP